MANQGFKVDGGLVITDGLTVEGGAVDFSGATGGGQSLYELSNVNTSSSPTNGQALVWDNTNSYWTPATVAGSGGIALSDLSVTQASASGTGTLAYNNVSGVFTYTPPDLSGYAALTDLSVTTATGSGSGSLAYNNATGVFTFTPPNLSTYLTESSLTGSDLDMNGNKVLFGNLYPTEGDLPSASSYHGMFAHVHATGKGYFAHAGSWHKLLDETSSTTDHLSEGGTNLYYTEERVDDRVNTLIQAGSNITITYNDPGNQLTIAAAGGVIALSDLSVTTATASGGGSLAFNDTTGVFTFTPPDLSAKVELDDLSITTAANSASGSLVYNNVTGVFTFTPPDLTSYVTSVTIDSITDTNIVSPADNEFLAWDSASSKWINQTAAEAGLATVATSGQYSDLLNRIENTDDLTEGSTNLYYTDARVDSRLSGGSVATVTTTGNVTVGGNLTVSGTTTTVNTETINLADNTITLNSNFAGSSPTEDGGIEIERGTQTNKTLVWNETSDKWTVGSETFVAGTFEGALTGNVTGNVTGTVSDITNHSLYSLSNVFTSSAPSDGQVLTWDNSNSYWKPTTVVSGGGGSTTFLGLTDTPSAFTGAGGRLVKVNSGATALEFVTDDKIALTDLSVTTASAGSAALSYNNSSGVLTFTPPDLSSYLTTSSDTDDLSEGSTNLYHTTARARSSISANNGAVGSGDGSISYNQVNGEITYTKPDFSSYIALSDLSVTTASASGDGSLAYNNSTGVFTFTPAASSGGGSIAYLASQNTNSATASGTGALALGGNSSASSTNYSLAIGNYANASGNNAVAIGSGASNDVTLADGGASVAIGHGAESSGDGTIAVGHNSETTGNRSIAVGESSTAALVAMALGYQATSAGTYSTAIGYNANAASNNQLMLGDASNSSGYTSIRVGNTSYTPSNNMDLATKAYVDANAGGSGPDYVAGSGTATAGGTNAAALGGSSSAGGTNSVALGNSTSAPGTGTVAIGFGAAVTNSTGGVSIGYYSDASNSGTAVGAGFGSTSRCYAGNTGAAFGYVASAAGNQSVSLGAFSDSNGTNGCAVGYNAQATTSYATSVGGQSTGSGSYSTGIGYGATASGYNATAIGNGSSSTGSNKFVLGNTAISDLRCQDTSISATSDSRDKTQIEALSVGLNFVNAIEPKAFYKNNRGAYYTPQYTLQELLDDETLVQSYTFDQASYDAATYKFDKREFGFISQDVAAQLPAEYSDARVSFNEDDEVQGFNVQHFTMGDMTPILWKALRELSDKHDQLQTDYDALLARVVALENA